MTRILLATIALGALAACDTGMTSDTGLATNVEYSYDEFDNVYPGTSETTLRQIDSDADGMITENELQAARDDGMI